MSFNRLFVNVLWPTNCLSFEDVVLSSSGNRRFEKLYSTALEGGTVPPVDLRYLQRPRSSTKGHEARADVIEFLSNLYISTAETLPDVKDDPLTSAEELKVRVPNNGDPLGDLYAEKMAEMVAAAKTVNKRKKKKGIEINQLRANMEQRFLPPGTMRDFWEQYRLHSQNQKPASFPTFWRVPWQ